MKRTFNFGKIDFTGSGVADNPVYVKMEYKDDGDKKRFSVSAEVWNRRHSDILAGGQCLDEIAPYIKNPVFSEIFRLWKLYHLNDMHPECEHQAAEGWREKAKQKVILYHWKMTTETARKQKDAKEKAIKALKAGETFTPTEKQAFFSSLPYSLTTHTGELPKNIAGLYEPKKPLFPGDNGHKEEKALGWLKVKDHPEGLLCRPCPVCGYKYGTGWNYFPVPEEDEKIIYSLLKNGGFEQ